MRSVIAKITLTSLFLSWTAARSREPSGTEKQAPHGSREPQAEAVLERAIEAHGGASRLEQTKKGRLKAAVEGKLKGEPFQVVWEETFDLPGRYHRTVKGTVGGNVFDMTGAVAGSRGWIRQEQKPLREFPVLEQPSLEQHGYAILAQILQLRNKDSDLQLLGEETKDGRRLVGIRAVSSRAAADLYFDKSTGLLARARRPLPSFVTGKEKTIGENVFEDYHDIQGIRYPMHLKATSDGANALNFKIISLEFLDKVDPNIFDKPETPRSPESAAPPEMPMPPSTEPPPRWDMRFLVATLAVGAVIAVVWLIVHNSKERKQEKPPQ